MRRRCARTRLLRGILRGIPKARKWRVAYRIHSARLKPRVYSTRIALVGLDFGQVMMEVVLVRRVGEELQEKEEWGEGKKEVVI